MISELDGLSAALRGLGIFLAFDTEKGTASIAQKATGRVWQLKATRQELIGAINAHEASGEEAGVGNVNAHVTPGTALLAIHIDEAVSTAREGTNRLVLTPYGVEAE